jgi:serine/threonine-protein phosphatase 2A regulatory subunit B'
MSSTTAAFVDRIDPFAKRSLKKKQKKSQGSSRYRNSGDVELQALPLLKGKIHMTQEVFSFFSLCSQCFSFSLSHRPLLLNQCVLYS